MLLKRTALVCCILSVQFSMTSYAQTLYTGWAYGLGAGDNDIGFDVITDASSNVYITGTYVDGFDFDPGVGDYTMTAPNEQNGFLLKLDATGNFVWAIPVGTVGFGLTFDQAGNILVTGRVSAPVDFDPGTGNTTITPTGGDDIFVAKYTPAGAMVWAKGFGGTSNENATSLVSNSADEVIITGTFSTSVDFDAPGPGPGNLTSNGSQDIFILALDADGDFVWVKQIGGINRDEANAIAITSSDELIIVGEFRGANIDFDPGTSTHPMTSSGPSINDIYVLKLSSSGGFMWADPMGSGYNSSGTSVAVDDEDNIYFGGTFRGTIDFNTNEGSELTTGLESNAFVAKWDTNNGFIWATLTPASSSIILDIAIDPSHNVYVTGETSAGTSSDVVYIAKFDNSGNSVWENYNPYSHDDGGNTGHAIAFSIDGDIYVTGEYMEAIDFGFNGCTFRLDTDPFDRNIFVEKITTVSPISITSFNPTAGMVGSTFVVNGNGFSPFSYENEVRINGELASIDYATTMSIQANVPDGGSGPITVTAYCNTATSSTNFDIINIYIMSQPSSVFVCEGTNATFNAPATGTTNITYRWQYFNGAEWDDLSDGPGISGSTTSSLSLNTTGEIGTTEFRCEISGDFVSAKHSRIATLTVSPLPCTPPPTAPSLTWAKNMTAVAANNIGHSIAVDATGNVYTTGRFEGTVDFDPGVGTHTVTADQVDAYVSKFDANGNFVWVKTFGGPDYEYGSSIAVDNSGNILFTGRFYFTVDFDPGPATLNLTSGGEMDMFVVKLTPNGDLIWAKSVGADGLEEGLSLATDLVGNVYITGHFGSVVDFDPGPGTFTISSSTGDINDYDVFILKLASNGNFVWAKAIGNSGIDEGRGIAVDGAGNSYITGQFDNYVDMDPGPGDFGLTSLNGGFSAYLLKLDPNGNFEWARPFGGDGSQNYGYDVEIDASNSIYVTGTYEGAGDFDPDAGVSYFASTGETDIYIVKFNAEEGDFVWGKSFGGTDFDEPFSIDTDNFGNVFLLLWYFKGTMEIDPDTPGTTLIAAGDQDFALLKFDSNGEYVWGTNFGGTDYDFGMGLFVDKNNNVYTTGFFQETADFNPSLLCALTLDANAGGTTFIQKFNASAVACPGISSHPAPQTVCAGASATFNVVASGPDVQYQWQKFDGSTFQNISDGSGYVGTTTADLSVNTSGSFGTGNYRCIVTAGNANPLTSNAATLTIGSGITPPTVTGTSSCIAGSFTLSAMGATNGQYRWYTAATGGTAISGVVNDSYTTPTLSSTTSYFVAIDNGSCESPRTEVIANVLTTPIAPAPGNASACSQGPVIISASGGTNGEYRWYTTSTGGTAIAGQVNSTFATPAITTTNSYFVSIHNGSCEGSRAEVIATILPPPSAPVTTDAAVCNQGAVTLIASGGTAGQYRWYTASSGGAAISGETNSTYTTPSLTTTTVFFVSINNGCESTRNPVTATINPLPAKPVITSVVTIVSNTINICTGTATLIAPAGFAQYHWSTNATTQQIQAGAGNFSVTVTDNKGCVSIPSDVVQIACLNNSPAIEQVPLTTQVNSEITLALGPLLSDPDDNLDPSSLTIVVQPSSGAIATIDANGMLRVDYSGVTFSGTDQLTIRVCDLDDFCTDQVLSIEVVGEVVVYDAFSPNGDDLNSIFFLQHIEVLEETKNNHVYIYNRWGDVVFDVKNYNNTTRVFRGLSNSGSELTSGTYFYKIEYGNGKTKTGYLALKK